MLILPYNDIVTDGTFHAPCPGAWNFHLEEGQERMVRGQGAGLCQISSLAPSYLLLTLLHPAFCPRNATCADFKSPALWLPGSSSHGETCLSGRSEGGGWSIDFFGSFPAELLWAGCVHQAKVAGPLMVALCIHLSPSRFRKPFFSLVQWTQECNRSVVLSLGY